MTESIAQLSDRVDGLEAQLAESRARDDRLCEAMLGVATMLENHASMIEAAVGAHEEFVRTRCVQVVDAHGRVVIELTTGDDDEPKVHLIHRNVDGEIHQVQENNLYPNKHRKE